MDMKERYVKETGDKNQYLTYQNDYKEFVISEKFYKWIEAKFISGNSDHTKCDNCCGEMEKQFVCENCGKRKSI